MFFTRAELIESNPSREGERVISTLKPYPAYKDSGVPWLGKVPAHWEVVKLKSISKRMQNGSTPPTDILEYYADEGLPWYGPPSFGSRIVIGPPMRFVTERAIADRKVRVIQPPALAVSVIGNVGKSALLLDPGATNQQITSFELNDQLCNPRFVVNQFRLTEESLVASASSATIAIIDSLTLRNTPLALPPLPEQTAIVRFLDYMDRRIRRYVRAKQKLIKLLEEYKQALIHQAVTGRIDVRTGQPYPAYKDSGVEWLGEVPAHWEVVPLRWFISIASGDFIETSAVSGDRSNERPYPVIGGNGVMGYAGVYNSKEITVVVGRVGALCGNVHIVNEPAWITDNALRITLIREFSYKFLSIQLKVIDLNRLANANAQPLVTGGIIKAQRVVKPPLPEQTAIVEYLDAQTAKIDTAIAAARREIKLLREYRTRLIADVVTGKVDVREVAAQLPEEPKEPELLIDADEGEGEASEMSEINGEVLEDVADE